MEPDNSNMKPDKFKYPEPDNSNMKPDKFKYPEPDKFKYGTR